MTIDTERDYQHAVYVARHLREDLIPGIGPGIRADILRRLLPLETAISDYDRKQRALRATVAS